MRILHLSDGTTLTPSRGRWEKQKIVAVTLTNPHALRCQEREFRACHFSSSAANRFSSDCGHLSKEETHANQRRILINHPAASELPAHTNVTEASPAILRCCHSF
jgi:hypothetical protein